MSVRVVLDLLDQFANTRIISLFHIRMWQSKYSEINVHLVQHWVLLTWLVTCVKADTGFLHSIMLNSFFMNRTCFDLLGTGRFLPPGAVQGSLPKTGCSILSWRGIGFGWFKWELLNCWTTCPSSHRATSEPNSFIQSCLNENFGGGRRDVTTFSYMTSQVSIKTTFGKR